MTILDLEQPRFAGMPIHPSHKPGYFYALHRRHADVQGSRRTSASGVLTMMEHSGTHIDALSHQAADHCLYGGRPAHEAESAAGFSSHGVEEIPPIHRRAVFADLGKLPPRYEFTADDLQAAIRVDIRPGDILLVRTGFGTLWHNEAEYLNAAGAHKSASLWAAEKQVYAVGADNMAWDLPGVVDNETGVQLFAHFYLLAQRGIYIIENLNLEALSASGANECQFVCLPLKLNGATGSPVRPIAIL